MPEESFDFLGYTLGRCYRIGTGKAYIGTRPSKKRVLRVCERVSQMTQAKLCWRETEEVVGELNLVLRGWANLVGYSDTDKPKGSANSLR